jgi:hypothetical protein
MVRPGRADLNAVLDRLEERHTLFGGGIEAVAFEHPGTPKRSALAHTMATGRDGHRSFSNHQRDGSGEVRMELR